MLKRSVYFFFLIVLLGTLSFPVIYISVDASSGKYCGSIKSDVYHYPSCHYVDQIKPENLIWFIDEYDAVNKGYRPCKGCAPPLPSSTTLQATLTSSRTSISPSTSTSPLTSSATPTKTSSLSQTATTEQSTYSQISSQTLLYLVAEVIDGDSIILDDESEIRLLGVNAPEQGYPYHEEGKIRLSSLILGKQVLLESDFEDKDQYDRLLRYVFIDNTLVNVQLVRDGLATVYMEDGLKYEDQLLEAEYYAQFQGVGLWEKDLAYVDSIYLVELHYDAAGNDNENLNDEYLILGNKGDAPLDITDWTITDEANHQYTFPLFVLNPEAMVIIYSGSGQNTEDSLYWGNQGAIWNNDGDTFYLRNEEGELIFFYEYPPSQLTTRIQSTTHQSTPQTSASTDTALHPVTSEGLSDTLSSFQNPPVTTANVATASNVLANSILGAITMLILGGMSFIVYRVMKKRRKASIPSRAAEDTYCMHCGLKNPMETRFCMKCGTELESDVSKPKRVKFEVYRDSSGQFRFRLRAANNEIIATGEAYKTKAACINGIESVKISAPTADIEDKTI